MKFIWDFLDSEDDSDEDDLDEGEGWWYGPPSPWIDKNRELPHLWQRVFVVIANGTVYNTMYCGEPASDWRFGEADILYWMAEPDTSGLTGINTAH